jgi:hypothetical protein
MKKKNVKRVDNIPKTISSKNSIISARTVGFRNVIFMNMYFVLRSSSSGNNIIFFDIACSLDTAYFIDFSFLLVAESNEAHFFSACGNTYFETVHKLYPFKQMIFTDPDLD